MRSEFFARHSQTMADNGFGITPIIPATKRPRYRKWQAAGFLSPNPIFLERHLRKHPTDSIAIVCGRIVGIDIDATDPIKADDLYRAAVEALGDTPLIRIGKWPARVMVYSTVDEVHTARSATVEILGRGGMFVAFGIHPETKRSYYWLDASPTDVDATDIPSITRDNLSRFSRRASAIIGATLRSGYVRPANDNARTSISSSWPSSKRSSAIQRNDASIVIDGREQYLRDLIWDEYRRGYKSLDELAQRAWARFASGADLAAPKRHHGSRRWSYRDALTKAKEICRRRPALRYRRAAAKLDHINSYRRPDYWTDGRKAEHHDEAIRRAMTPAALTVSRCMLGAIDFDTGQGNIPVSRVTKETGLSESAVKTARRDLRNAGLWIAERGVYVPVPIADEPELTNQAA